MFSRLSVENFQGFRGFQEIPLAPITLIFGPNSSGKSSVARSFNFLRESLSIPNLNSYSLRGQARINYRNLLYSQMTSSEVNSWLGSEVEAQLKFDLSKTYETIKIGYKVNLVTDEKMATFSGTVRESVQLECFEAEVASGIEFNKTVIGWLQIQLNSEFEDPKKWAEAELEHLEAIFKNEAEDQPLRDRLESEIAERTKIIEKLSSAKPAKPLLPEIRFSVSSKSGLVVDKDVYGCVKTILETRDDRRFDPFGQDYEDWTPDNNFWDFDQIERYFKKRTLEDVEYEYLGRIETELFEIVTLAGRKPLLDLARFLFVDPIRSAPAPLEVDNRANEQASYTKKINVALGHLTEGRYSYETTELQASPFNKAFGNLIRDNFTGAQLEFTDVGSGLGQLVPMLAALYSSNATCVYIEQPELHLHPKLQSDLMDLFIEEYLSAKDAQTSRQFLIETHSESMLLRIQKRIRESHISQDEVKVLFVDAKVDPKDKKKRSNFVSEIQLDKSGDILDPLPISFVNLRIEDLL